MTHPSLILLIILALLTGIVLPYIPGEYDHFAAGISSVLQFASFATLLFVPAGIYLYIRNSHRRQTTGMPTFAKTAVFTIAIIVIMAGALGALVVNNRFSAIIICIAGVLLPGLNRKKFYSLFSKVFMPYYLVIIPLVVVTVRLTFLEKIKNNSTAFVIQQCEPLIRDIELYKTKNGHYPLSLLSTIEDYKPGISGISRFYYEPKGNAYNIFFEQLSTMVGTQEFVMYNKLNEQEMTVHNQDLLRIPYNNIFHGHHKVAQLAIPHWKIFYFD